MLNGDEISAAPKKLEAVQKDNTALGLAPVTDIEAGALLRVLAAAKPGGNLLQFGSGRGEPTAWLAAGMAITSRLITLVVDPALGDIARRHFGDAINMTVHEQEPGAFLRDVSRHRFDLICCDELPEDFTVIVLALKLLNPGGLFAVIGLNPVASWPGGYAARIFRLLDYLRSARDYQAVRIQWSAGVVLAAHNPAPAKPRRRRRSP